MGILLEKNASDEDIFDLRVRREQYTSCTPEGNLYQQCGENCK
jgi:hypothetical protein